MDRALATSMLANAVVQGMGNQARKAIASARLADRQRPIGEVRLDIDFYSAAEREKPTDDYDFMIGKQRYVGTGARWCVVRVRWDGNEWKRTCRLTGPMKFEPALRDCSERCAKTGMQRA